MQTAHQADLPRSANGYGDATRPSSSEKSPISSIPFLKHLTSDKKQTKDGQPAKRRGPKPDSKPALTRRQELNRQAQRTHRERKEMYIKALETEVLRLKETYVETTRECNKVKEENERLKQLLAQHGISYDFNESPVNFKRENSGYGPSSSGSISGSYRGASDSAGFSPTPPTGLSGDTQMQQNGASSSNAARSMAQLPSNHHIDYDSTGIEFVLELERPCMDHMQYLLVRTYNSEAQDFHHPQENADDRDFGHMSGHVLMSTCPPYTHIMSTPNHVYPHAMPSELGTPGLTKLLDLSSRLPIDHDSEVTPIMAWKIIYQDSRVSELNAEDFLRLKTELSKKIRCYGFGAVLEEFEVHDLLASIFASKDAAETAPETAPAMYQAFAAQHISVA